MISLQPLCFHENVEIYAQNSLTKERLNIDIITVEYVQIVGTLKKSIEIANGIIMIARGGSRSGMKCRKFRVTSAVCSENVI